MKITQQEIKDLIREKGLKATPNRISVYEYLINSKEHPSAEMVKDYLNEQGNKFSLATVYNILEAFVETGLITRVKEDENGMMRFDANTGFHIHIYNNNTNEIIDYENEEKTSSLMRKLKEIKEQGNYSDDYTVVAEM